MKCPVCGTHLNNGAEKCATCGTVLQNQNDTQNYSGKTKSKTLAGILMLLGYGDFYLLNFGKFFKKLLLGMFTCFIGCVIWDVLDAVKIFNGTINCDAKGTPLV